MITRVSPSSVEYGMAEVMEMERALAFGEVLEVVDKLSLEEQETLVEVVRRRIIERRREELAKEMRDAQEEFQAGHCRPVIPDELMTEILS